LISLTDREPEQTAAADLLAVMLFANSYRVIRQKGIPPACASSFTPPLCIIKQESLFPRLAA